MYTNRTYILWRGRQRGHFTEDDITADRISAVFRVSGVFLSYLHCQIISLNVAGLRCKCHKPYVRWCCYLGIMILFKNRKGIGWSRARQPEKRLWRVGNLCNSEFTCVWLPSLLLTDYI